MPRKRGPSFELPLRTGRALAVTLDAARNACNAILRQVRRRDFMRRSKAEQAGTATPCGAPRSTERKARATAFKQVFAAFGVTSRSSPGNAATTAANKRGDTHYDDGGVCPYYRQRYFDLDVKLNLISARQARCSPRSAKRGHRR